MSDKCGENGEFLQIAIQSCYIRMIKEFSFKYDFRKLFIARGRVQSSAGPCTVITFHGHAITWIPLIWNKGDGGFPRWSKWDVWTYRPSQVHGGSKVQQCGVALAPNHLSIAPIVHLTAIQNWIERVLREDLTVVNARASLRIRTAADPPRCSVVSTLLLNISKRI